MTSIMPGRAAQRHATTVTTDTEVSIEHTDAEVEARAEQDLADAGRLPLPIAPRIPFPLALRVSGLYRRSNGLVHPIGFPLSPAAAPEDFTPNPEGPELPRGPGGIPFPGRIPIPTDRLPGRIPSPVIPQPWRTTSEELRLDVDGRYPQMVVSGEIRNRLFGRCSWIAHVTARPGGGWEGDITYKQGTASLLPHTHVEVQAAPYLISRDGARVTFSGPGTTTSVRTYAFASTAFHEVEMEFDRTSDSDAVTTFDTSTHPNRPASLRLETLSIETVFARAGFTVRRTTGDDVVPLAKAGADALWTEQEMHDAMQTYWSKWADVPQWSVWTLFAGRSSRGPGLGGIMFDDIGPAQRQGCAVFSRSFISDEPPADPNRAAYARRMRFWTAVHELGHTFNLAHSWQKSLGNPWIPLPNEPNARSFMNYPYNVPGSVTAFFADFEYRFSDAELLYLRHAPSQFVEQGNSPWFTDHGFSQAAVSPEPAMALTLRVQRPAPIFEFLEPVVVELKLENITDHPIVVNKNLLDSSGSVTLLATDRKGEVAQIRPFASACMRDEQVALMPGESLYTSMPVSTARGGTMLVEPGYHALQACLHLPEEDVVSGMLRVKIMPPQDRNAEALAPDVLTEDVRRVLEFGGSRVLHEANDVLRSVVEQLPGTAIATTAAFALAKPMAAQSLVLRTEGEDGQMRIDAEPGDIGEANNLVELVGKQETVNTLGHVGLHRQVSEVVDRLAGDRRQVAAKLQTALIDVMEPRGIKPAVMREMKEVRDDLKNSKKK